MLRLGIRVNRAKDPAVTVPLNVANLSKQYDAYLALAPAAFAVQAGEVVVLTGSNGSGKTTLLSCLSGLIPPTTGTVTVCGFDLYRDEVEVRRRLVFVPDVPRFYQELTAWEHMRFIALANDSLEGFDRRAQAILEKLGLWQARNLFPHHYSRGMRLKLGLALALIRPFQVLILDEPTSALDVESTGVLLEELRRLRGQGAAVLLTTHDPHIRTQVGDRFLTIRQGVIEEA